MHFSRLVLGLFATAAVAGHPAAAGAAGAIPLADFFKNEEFSQVRLAPDGTHLAGIVRTQAAPQARNLIVMNVDTRKAQVITGYDTEDVSTYFWANDDQLIFTLTRGSDDPNKTATYVGTYIVSRDGRRGRHLDGKDRRSMDRSGSTQGSGANAKFKTFLSKLAAERDQVLVDLYDRRFLFPDVYRLNTRSGSIKKVQTNFSNVSQWVPDHAGEVRIALDEGSDLEDQIQHLLLRGKDGEWRELWQGPSDDLIVEGFSADNRSLFVVARHNSDLMKLYQVDLASGDFGPAIVEDAVYDVGFRFTNSAGLRQDDRGKVVSFSYMADTPRQIFFAGSWQARSESLDRALPGTHNEIVDWSDDESRFLVHSSSDTVPGVYHLYDEKKNKLTRLVSVAPWLDDVELARMRPIEFAARDGLTVRGYLTLPPGSSGEAVPLIVHPHGGPYGIRDQWGFDPDVQFLASRGYGVLQINYRGSGGYGSHYEADAYRKWGLEMQDDITDGVRWAIAAGHADPKRVCIYGASYGGYATMMGLVKTPAIYKCGINYVGVVDLAMTVRDSGKHYNVSGLKELSRAYLDLAIGDPARDKARFDATSPINHVEKIQAPVLVVHGLLDPQVDIEQYRRLIGELRRHDKPHETMLKTHEGHGFYAEANKVELYTRIEKFLASNL